jgi:hypothetical protein
MNTQRHKLTGGLLISLLLAFLSLAVFSYFFVVIQKKNINIAKTTLEVDHLNQSLNEQATIKKTLQTTQEERDQLSSYFITSDNVVGFLERIEGYASKTNTTIVITDVDIDEDLNVLNFSLSASGVFADLYQLLLLLENAPVEFDFQGTSFSQVGPSGDDILNPESTNGAPIWSAEFNMHLISFEAK